MFKKKFGKCKQHESQSCRYFSVMFAVIFIRKRLIIIGFIKNNSAEQFFSSQLNLHNIRPEVRQVSFKTFISPSLMITSSPPPHKSCSGGINGN